MPDTVGHAYMESVGERKLNYFIVVALRPTPCMFGSDRADGPGLELYQENQRRVRRCRALATCSGFLQRVMLI